MEYRFDPYTRSFSAVYPEYYDAYYSAEDEEEAARRARKRRRMRNLAIGAGAAAALAGGGLLYLRHKGNGNIGRGFNKFRISAGDKISGGRISKLEATGRDYQKLVKSQNSKINNLKGALEGTRNALTKERDMYKRGLSKAMGKIRTGHFSED